jgi:hypothetical protein
MWCIPNMGCPCAAQNYLITSQLAIDLQMEDDVWGVWLCHVKCNLSVFGRHFAKLYWVEGFFFNSSLLSQ